MTAPQPTRSMVDVVITVVLIAASLGLGFVLFLIAIQWAADTQPRAIGFFLGVYPSIFLPIIGAILGITAIVRRRRGFVYPLAAIVLSLLAFWIGSLLAG
jgi:hypothetical protein